MYQFSALFKEMNPNPSPASYRWRGLLCGILGGWLPAWILAHRDGWGTWSFIGAWVGIVPLSYGIGSLFKKKRD